MAYGNNDKQKTPSEIYELLQLILQKQEQFEAQLQKQAQAQAQLQKQLQDQNQKQLQDQDQRQKQLQDQDQDQKQLQGQSDYETESISFGDIGNNKNKVTVKVDNYAIAVLALVFLRLSKGNLEDDDLKGYLDALITKSSFSE
ncbi:hypothetical protein [Clostridium fungisolvens]|uniref:Uncharacterized protein n=1 Tax=Clostridium fungisolvens TaxID=1604897 RepID=A0A6V8SLE2_9CLOT|nr:hypothetical protein [Clostridium fungisolvens]GFP77372.1 hypothetical protein bsdtw1_03499 [Clostridium fungisolvens]